MMTIDKQSFLCQKITLTLDECDTLQDALIVAGSVMTQLFRSVPAKARDRTIKKWVDVLVCVEEEFEDAPPKLPN